MGCLALCLAHSTCSINASSRYVGGLTADVTLDEHPLGRWRWEDQEANFTYFIIWCKIRFYHVPCTVACFQKYFFLTHENDVSYEGPRELSDSCAMLGSFLKITTKLFYSLTTNTHME